MTLDNEQEHRSKRTRQRRPSRLPTTTPDPGRRGGGTATADAEPAAEATAPYPRLLDTYRNEIVPAMVAEFGFTNTMRVPRVQKSW